MAEAPPASIVSPVSTLEFHSWLHHGAELLQVSGMRSHSLLRQSCVAQVHGYIQHWLGTAPSQQPTCHIIHAELAQGRSALLQQNAKKRLYPKTNNTFIHTSAQCQVLLITTNNETECLCAHVNSRCESLVAAHFLVGTIKGGNRRPTLLIAVRTVVASV